MKNFREIMYNSTKFHLEEFINEENTKFSRKKCQRIEPRKNFVKSIAFILSFHEEIPETGSRILSNEDFWEISQSKYDLI